MPAIGCKTLVQSLIKHLLVTITSAKCNINLPIDVDEDDYTSEDLRNNPRGDMLCHNSLAIGELLQAVGGWLRVWLRLGWRMVVVAMPFLMYNGGGEYLKAFLERVMTLLFLFLPTTIFLLLLTAIFLVHPCKTVVSLLYCHAARSLTSYLSPVAKIELELLFVAVQAFMYIGKNNAAERPSLFSQDFHLALFLQVNGIGANKKRTGKSQNNEENSDALLQRKLHN
ncbi:hypothetical protein BT69DRAFT_1293069 [Atractiella rhizophila]|nr:hypothetical protein BT69DRAFT_1293069 [Atractiella rhizophila]